MVKVFFADHGTKADALAAVQRIRGWASERNAENVAIARSYVDGTGPFPERATVLVLTGSFLRNFADMPDRGGKSLPTLPATYRASESKQLITEPPCDHEAWPVRRVTRRA
jgi:PadR family transcriptional regulator AphA